MEIVNEAEILTESAPENRPTEFPTKYIFEELDRAGVRYALLRGHDELFQDLDYLEIDLLVHEKDVKILKDRLKPYGFVEVPSWGHAPHRFVISFSKKIGQWVKLDIVTELCYGQPIRKYKIDLAHFCLDNRLRNGLCVLAPEFELLTTLLHCLLDKGRFDPKHKQRLLFLAGKVKGNRSSAAVLEALSQRNVSEVLNWNRIRQLILNQDWTTLLGMQPFLEASLSQKGSLRSTWRHLSNKVVRKMRPLFLAIRKRGVSVVLLAPDGAGKSTLAQRLVNDKILRARLIYMGTNVEAATIKLPFTRPLARLVKSMRAGKREKTPFGMILRLLNLLNKIAEHWYRCLMARYALLRGRFVVFDRFVYDSWIQKRRRTLWKRFRNILFDAPCPTPDLVFLLDADGEVLYARKGEHSPEWIDAQRAGYHKLMEILPQMTVVDASQSADNVRKEVTRLIWNKYGNTGSRSGNGSSS